MSAVHAEGLSKTYRRGAEQVVAIDQVSFRIEPGEVVGLVGASGSGKSTLLNLLAGFDLPDAGRVQIGETEVTRLDGKILDAMRTRVLGFVFQHFHLIAGLNARENVELALMPAGLAAGERRRRAEEALARVGLAGLECRRPGQLSGGQQQRVAIARAFAGAPMVVLADEPTAALDAQTASALLDQISELARSGGAAVVLSTHDARCIARCDRIIALENGRLA